VTYGNGLFVAVSSSGTGDRVMTSPDGITWIIRASAADNVWNSVTYGGGLFVAVSSSGTGNRVMTSPDGITWTSRTSAADNSWNSVTYGGGTFVAVSSTGVGNRVMTSVGTPPGAPVITGATAGQTSVAVAFTADDSGGSTITRLEFALDDTTAVDDSTASLSSPYTLSNLSPGTAYTVYMRAVNTAGTGPWSAPQGFATSSPPAPPSPPNPVVFPPGAPTGLTAVAGDASASVSWVAPSDSGSFPVTDYEVAPAPIGGSCLVKAPATSCEVTGLANGTSYTFTVRALNGAGWGAWSAPSNAVTPSPSVVKAIQITGIYLVQAAWIGFISAVLGGACGLVLAALLVKKGVAHVIATDTSTRALACARQNIESLGLKKQITLQEIDLFPAGRADLVVCNPPWLPGRPASPLEHAIYDQDQHMLSGFLSDLAEHLNPKGQGWLILSDLAEHLHLRSREQLLAQIEEAGLVVLAKHDIRPHHPKAKEEQDPLADARQAETTSLWCLGVAPT
jgi:hypothetical protein